MRLAFRHGRLPAPNSCASPISAASLPLYSGSNEWGHDMPMNDRFAPIAEQVELLLTEVREIKASGPHFWILHRFREPETDCAPGEEIVAIFLVYRGRAYLLRLSLAQRLLFDYLAQHRHLAQSASQIAAGMHADPFYRMHGYNGGHDTSLTRRICRSFIRQYIRRIHLAVSQALKAVRLTGDPKTVLVPENLGGNEVRYHLRATCAWLHDDIPKGRKCFQIKSRSIKVRRAPV